jgi:hypothetical protein
MSEPTESRPDLDPAEEFAEAAGVDPTPEQVAEYQRMEGDLPEPADEAEDAGPGDQDPSVS